MVLNACKGVFKICKGWQFFDSGTGKGYKAVEEWKVPLSGQDDNVGALDVGAGVSFKDSRDKLQEDDMESEDTTDPSETLSSPSLSTTISMVHLPY